MYRVELKEDQITPMLVALSKHFDDLSTLMNAIGDDLVKSTKDRMRRGETPEGLPFAPRSQSTLDIYARKGFSYGLPLNRSGDMIKEINFFAGKDFVEVGSNERQSAVMQYGAAKGSLGGGSPWGDIPARPYIGISDQDNVDLLATINDWLTNATKGGA